MNSDNPSRRELLAAGSVLTAAAVGGCLDAGDEENEAMDELDLHGKDSTFTVGPEGPGIDFAELVDIDGDFVPEGLAYRNGHLYTGERDGPATIREFTVDGEPTGEEFNFDDVRINHTNTMDWVDGDLWVSDSSTMATYIVDWDDLSLIDQFDHGGPVTGTWRCIVPTSTGEQKLVFNEWLGTRAWVVDLESTLEDGTTRGNVDREVKNGLWTNPQTMEWHDGSLYTTTHSWVIKSQLPYIDRLNDGYPLTSYNVEWAYEFEHGETLEQLVYNPDDKEFYLVDRGWLGTIFAGRETYGEHRNKSFAEWDTTDGGFGADAVIRVDEERTATLELTNGDGQQKVGWIETWMYDNGNDANEVALGPVTHQNDAILLGIWAVHDAGADRYVLYDGEEWVDTGVDRAANSWVKFGWSVHSNRIDTFVSTSHGRTWSEVGRVEGDRMSTHRLRIRHQNGLALVGNWTLELQNLDDT